ncbi:MAG: inorganic diphosphatase, partial [Parascardovia denticolens]
IDDIPDYHRDVIDHFFNQYKALEPGKEVQPGSYWTNASKANEDIVAARQRLAESEK